MHEINPCKIILIKRGKVKLKKILVLEVQKDNGIVILISNSNKLYNKGKDKIE